MSSPRAAEYRELIDDVIAGGLLEQDEIDEIKDLIARVQARIQVSNGTAKINMPHGEAAE